MYVALFVSVGQVVWTDSMTNKQLFSVKLLKMYIALLANVGQVVWTDIMKNKQLVKIPESKTVTACDKFSSCRRRRRRRMRLLKVLIRMM